MNTPIELADRLAGLTLAQAVELKTLLKVKYGIEPAGVGTVLVPRPGHDTPRIEPGRIDPTEFNVILDGADPAKKINVIRVVRELTGQGLAEAKATVESGPKAIKEGVDKKTADELKKKLEDAGARVSVQPA